MCCDPLPLVTTPADPLVIGEPDGTPARFVRAERAVWGLSALQHAWVTGTGVDALGDDLTPASPI